MGRVIVVEWHAGALADIRRTRLSALLGKDFD